MDELYFYVIRNKHGKYFRRKGYSGYGQSWVDDIEKARTYNKIGSARTVVTFFARQYPEYGTPDIICYKAIFHKTMDEQDRVEKANKKAEEKKQRRIVDRNKRELKRAEEALKLAQEAFDRLHGEQ